MRNLATDCADAFNELSLENVEIPEWITESLITDWYEN